MPPQIPLNSLIRHMAPLTGTLAQTAERVIQSGYFVLGPHVATFEARFAAYCGTSHAVGVANGTDALEIALRALDVGKGDLVAVVANAAMYSTTAVLACGATPVFVDIDPATQTMSAGALAAAASQRGLKAVIVTHLYGRLADMESILEVCRAHDIRVLEDCAQAHGARADGRVAGSFGDIASFSFYPTKNLGAIGDGGAITTSDEALARKSVQLRQYGWSAKYTNELPGGRNSRLDEIQAAMLLDMLPLLDGWNDRRRTIANRYSDRIRNSRIQVPAPGGREYVAHLFVVTCEERERLREHLGTNGVQTDVHYPVPDYRQPCLAAAGPFDALPVTERMAATVLTLPCFPELEDAEVEAVIDACNRF